VRRAAKRQRADRHNCEGVYICSQLGSPIAVRARNISLCEMSVGMVLCVDVAERCAWLATPDGSQRHRTNISMTQVRGLHKAGLITTRRDRNAIHTTFVISAKGQAEVRRIKRRQSQLLTKASSLIAAGATDECPTQQEKTKLCGSSEAVSAPRSARDSLRQAVERALKSGSLIHEES
jgi:hypothetical protein